MGDLKLSMSADGQLGLLPQPAPHSERPRLSGWLSVPASMLAYAAIRMLMLVAPRQASRNRAARSSPHKRAAAFVGWFSAAYHGSPLRDRLKSEGRECVYLPTCTDYACRAVHKHGLVRGLALAGDRLRRCRDGGSGSYIDFP